MRDNEKRSERIDLRLTLTEKKILEDKARSTRRTVTSIVAQLIDEIDKIIPPWPPQ
jgi:uncharacterized protein (DUF1778 family)